MIANMPFLLKIKDLALTPRHQAVVLGKNEKLTFFYFSEKIEAILFFCFSFLLEYIVD